MSSYTYFNDNKVHFISVLELDLIYCTIQLTAVITDEGDAVQFLASATTATAFQNRPVQNPSVEDLIEYTLQVETQATAKNGAYSGTTDSLAVRTINTEHE